MRVCQLRQLRITIPRFATFLSDASRKTRFGTASYIRPSSTQASIQRVSFKPLPIKELTPNLKSRLRDRPFMVGSRGEGFPEYLAEPRESLPHAVFVHNPYQASLAELAAQCMEYVEENLTHDPAILFRNLPAQTAQDFRPLPKPFRGNDWSLKVEQTTAIKLIRMQRSTLLMMIRVRYQ